MKKTAICALAVCAMLLASCGGKGEEAVKEYRSICNEYVEAVKSGDMDKVASVNEKIRDFQEKYKDLDSEDFTDDQKQEILRLTTEVQGAALQSISEMAPATEEAAATDNDTE
jgi:hypothetical protein